MPLPKRKSGAAATVRLFFAALFISKCSGVAFAADESDYNYWTDSGAKPAWMPTSIKSSGGKTYIQFPDANLLAAPKPGETSKKPVLFIFSQNPGDPYIGQYRVVGDNYEVDSVIEKAVLIGPSGSADDKVLILHNPNGKQPVLRQK